MKKNIICLTILFGSASLSYAQTNDSISTDLNDVVVVASRKPTKISDFPLLRDFLMEKSQSNECPINIQ
jgi:hypothetical protein